MERANLPYRLARHVQACRTQGDIVMLDARSGNYLALSGGDAGALSEWIEGWPTIPSRGPSRGPEPRPPEGNTQPPDTIRQMIDAGIVVRRSPDDEPVRSSPEVLVPDSALIDGYQDFDLRIRPIDVIRFARASARAALLLRFWSIERIAARLEKRKQRLIRAGFRDSAMDHTRLRQLTCVFQRLSLFAYSSRNRCLFTSLALSEFLYAYGMRPSLVLGVSTHPFGAHCWLQYGPTVVNDTPANVRRFTPIMAV